MAMDAQLDYLNTNVLGSFDLSSTEFPFKTSFGMP
jgi:hypothetical protein